MRAHRSPERSRQTLRARDRRGAIPRVRSAWPIHRRASDRSPSPVSAHHARLPPTPASSEPATLRCRRPCSASAAPPIPTSQRVIVSCSRVPSHPLRSQTLTGVRRGARFSSSLFVMAWTSCKFWDRCVRAIRLTGFPYTSRHGNNSLRRASRILAARSVLAARQIRPVFASRRPAVTVANRSVSGTSVARFDDGSVITV